MYQNLVADDTDFAGFFHSFRNSVEDEFMAVINHGRDNASVCRQQLAIYRLQHPDILGLKPVIGGILIRRHMRENVIAAMQTWWSHVTSHSHRDQLSLRVALKELEGVTAIGEIDIRDNLYWTWPAPNLHRVKALA
jgi:hypothetical protein